MSVTCPLEDKSSTFAWVVAGTVLYPVGVPLFFLGVMWSFRVPVIARKKRNNAILHEMLARFKQTAAESLGGKIASYVGAGSSGSNTDDSSVRVQRAREMFRRACPDGLNLVSCSELVAYLATIGISGTKEEELARFFDHYDSDGNGALDEGEFQNMVDDIVSETGELSGSETMESLKDKHLEKLCRHPWHAMFVSDAEATGLNKEINRHIAENKKKQEKKRQLESFKASFKDTDGSLPSGQESFVFQEEEEEPPEAYVCHLDADAPRQEKLDWVIHIGNLLSFRGEISLPVLRWTGETQEEKDVISRIGFLFDSYKVQYWYFELLEMSRKLIMSSLLVFIYPGSPQQAAAGLFTTVFFLLIFLATTPYTATTLDNLQAISLTAQTATLFYGLMLGVEKLESHAGKVEQDAMTYLIIVTQFVIFILPGISFLLDPENLDKIRFHIGVCSKKIQNPKNRGGAPKKPPPAQVARTESAARAQMAFDNQHVVALRRPMEVADATLVEPIGFAGEEGRESLEGAGGTLQLPPPEDVQQPETPREQQLPLPAGNSNGTGALTPEEKVGTAAAIPVGITHAAIPAADEALVPVVVSPRAPHRTLSADGMPQVPPRHSKEVQRRKG
eukprot:CAMPEP_0181305812 /NCGR_PEP_ID=MMETSP1101-20121128/9944_1 /TAXON_ID=46948 /ORGANISM="Rhodomonas abbreviata, Strain Caron Lab Isolate" /LENGTH=618 /DNA_ID=CAMNT_0023411783 /DNA_START=413 /DNA_END=2269 /DNA_ORIENTATION=-